MVFLKLGRLSLILNLEFTTHVFRGFLARAGTDVIYTEFNKAFDRVDHGILFLKLSLIGILVIIRLWLGFYLSHSTQKVLFRNVLSNSYMLLLVLWRTANWLLYCFYYFSTILPCAISDCNILMYVVSLFFSVILNCL